MSVVVKQINKFWILQNVMETSGCFLNSSFYICCFFGGFFQTYLNVLSHLKFSRNPTYFAIFLSTSPLHCRIAGNVRGIYISRKAAPKMFILLFS